jgi:hypothetical protein
MTDQLSLYNGACRILKERRLASLSENREVRRLLDDAWVDGRTEGAVRFCLEQGQWAHGRRATQIDYDPDVATDFGFQYAFGIPEDFVRPVALCSDPYFEIPLLRYVDEAGYWYCDLQTIYVVYVSDGLTFGGDVSRWPQSFIELVQARLALEVAPNLTNSDRAIQWAEKAYKDALTEARSANAVRQPTRFMPPGSWSLSRHGSGSDRSFWNRRG